MSALTDETGGHGLPAHGNATLQAPAQGMFGCEGESARCRISSPADASRKAPSRVRLLEWS
jgi:hypothetical protein